MPADSWKLAAGLNSVGSYQVSGRPWASGSCVAAPSGSAYCIRFPAVTKWVQIEPVNSNGDHLRVAFSENGLFGKGSPSTDGGYNFQVHASSSLRGPLDLKVGELWFMSETSDAITFDLVVGLTGIPVERCKGDEGRSWSGSAGVG
jgi:hypothetical protein